MELVPSHLGIVSSKCSLFGIQEEQQASMEMEVHDVDMDGSSFVNQIFRKENFNLVSTQKNAVCGVEDMIIQMVVSLFQNISN